MNCPKCGSSNIHADKKGYSIKKGLIGGILVGGYGLLAGLTGSNKIRLTCLDCGFQFKPGEGATQSVKLQEPTIIDAMPTTPEHAPISYTGPRLKAPKTMKDKSKPTNWQKVRIETLLNYKDVINGSKVSYLEDLATEGTKYVLITSTELETLAKLQNEPNPIKRIITIKLCPE